MSLQDKNVFVSVEDIMEKGVVCAVMGKSAAGAELSSTAAAGQFSANLGRRQQTSTAAVLAATALNLLNYGSTAVARPFHIFRTRFPYKLVNPVHIKRNGFNM